MELLKEMKPTRKQKYSTEIKNLEAGITLEENKAKETLFLKDEFHKRLQDTVTLYTDHTASKLSFLGNKNSVIFEKLQRWKNSEKYYKMCFLKT